MDMQLLDSTLSIESDVADDFIHEMLLDDSQPVGENIASDALEESTILELVTVEAATHIATKSGSWFEASTWQNGQIPDNDARVIIPDGVAVAYDNLSDTRLMTLRVDGELNFAADVDTQMVVDTLVVSPIGALNIGSESSPLQSNITAKIVVADNGPIDTLWDPNQLSRGVLSLGTVDIYGQPKTPFLAAEMAPAAGDSNVVLETVPEDWQVGDTLVIAVPKPADDPLADTEESVQIAAIAGNRVTLDRPLQFDHEADGAADTYIANVSRNVVIETENAGKLPPHQRGHVLLSGSDAIDVRYAEFRELGRTNAAKPLDSPLLGPSDRTNIPGRYPLYLNQVGNPATDSPATLVGNSIVGSPGWGYVQADSHAVLDNNAAYDVIGAGFVAATDRESGKWLNNMAIKAEEANGGQPTSQINGDNIAADFWLQGAIESTDNISIDSPWGAAASPAESAVETVSLADSAADSSANIAAPRSVAASLQPAVLSMEATVDSLDARNAEMWEFEEWDLDNPTYSGNPFDLKASVTFTHTQSGEQRTTNMFYDGGDEWSFRFTGDLAGEWRFETDSRDQDLDGFTGKINVNPNDNPEVDGFLTSVGNKFAIQTDDANTLEGYLLNVYMNQAEHFKQGDLKKWNPSRTDAYLADARKNGSEVLYFQINNNWFDFGSEKTSEHNSRNPDEQTFELLEQVITDVHQQGGRVHFWAWGDRERGWIPKDGVNSEADQRLQSYIAARLGPLPGWSMGYSFDTQEFTDDSEIEFWADNLLSQMGWDHLLFARGYAASSDVSVNDSNSKNDWVAESLSGHSYSSKGRYQEGLQTSPVSPENIEEVIKDINAETSKPHFYEERFTYNRSRVGSTPGGPNDMDQTRQLMWWQAMAGGVGGWFGFFDWDGNQRPPYSNPEQLKTHYTFWHENDRFTLDLEQANNLADSSDTHLLKSADDSRYIVYTENRDAVQVDLPQLADDSKVIAVDAKKGYREIDLGTISEGKNRQIELPYRSDWAIAIESKTRSDGGSTPVPPPEIPTEPPTDPKVPETPDNPGVPEVPETPTMPSEDPILWWSLDDGSGNNADDGSGNNHDGSLSNGANWTADGQVNGALRLDGNQQLILDADAEDYLNGQDAITVSMWVKSDQVGTDRGFLTTVKTTGDDQNLGIRYDDSGAYGGGNDVIKVGLRTTEGVVEYESAANVQTQDWQHIVLSWRSGEAPKLYIDGQLDQPTAAAPAIGGTLAGITDLVVGKGQRIDKSWDGSIDDVRIYNRAIAAAEVLGLFNDAGAPANQAPVAAADTYTATAGEPLRVSAKEGVLTNDTDADGDSLSISSRTTTSDHGGSVALNADGSFEYTAPTDFVGSDSFDYTVSDGKDGSHTAQVTIEVAAATVPEEPEVPDTPETPTTPSKDPILWWTLDAGSGSNADDASGNNRDGSLSNGASWTADGQVNGALRLDGNQQLVIDADAEDYLNGQDAITVSMWVKSDQVGTDRGFLSTVKTTGDDQNLGIRYDDNGAYGGGNDVIKVGLRTTEGVVEYESAANVQTQEWQHIALSWRSGAAPKLYINGELDQPTASAGAIGGTLSGITDLIVGQGQRVPDAWDGSIDNVRIYDRALDAVEITAIYTEDTAPLNQAPVAQADAYTANAGETLVVSANEGLLANDTDADGDRLSSSTEPLSAHGGKINLHRDGSFDYTPADGFDGEDTFDYTVSDGQGGSDTVAVTVQVKAQTTTEPTEPTEPSKEPIVLWAMDEGNGSTAQDASGQGHDGTLKNGASWTDNGPLGGALRLDGKGQVVLDADAETYLNGRDAITVAMWVKSDQVGTDRGFLSTVTTTEDDQNLGIRYDDRGINGGGDDVIKVGLRTTEGVVEYESAANVQTQEWQHVVLSWNSGEAPQLYINGELDQPTAPAGAIGGTLSGVTDLIIGQGQRIPDSWDGNIDDVRIYDRALDTAEVSDLYRLGNVPDLTPVINPPKSPTPDLPDNEPTLGSHLERQLRSKDLNALQEIYNVTFNERGKPDVHIGMAASDVIMLKVQQNEFIREARNGADMVDESFDFNLNKNNVEIVGPNGQVFQPKAVHRKSKIADAAKVNYDFIIDHYFHLELPQDLDADAEYTVRFKNGNLDNIDFTPEDNVSLAIHHPRAYDATTQNKIAKLSSWMSKNGGGVDYKEGTPFQVVDEKTGQVVHSGGITLDASNDTFAGTDVYSLDLSSVKQQGTYRIEVEGIGKSLPFQVRENVWEDMLDLTMEGLYVHRAFAELEQPYTDFVRPGNPDIVYYPASVSEADFNYFDAGDHFKVLPQKADRSKPMKLTGGWFDAGDYDTRSVHLETVTTLIDLYSSNPDYFERFNPNIPESGDGIPDILNEAMWGLQLFKQLQQPDGGVSAGFEFDSHPSGTRSWEEKEAFVFAPDFRSTYRFVAAAAKMSTAIAPYDQAEADDLRKRAIRAFSWAEEDLAAQSQSFQNSGKADGYRQTAAVEMYRLTNQDKYHDVFRSISRDRNHTASFAYAQLDPKVYTAVDTQWQERLRNKVIEKADELVQYGEENGFDTVNNPAHGQNWGYNTVITNEHSTYLAMAHQLTGDDQYLNALADSMPFGMGMNPDNLSFTTGTKDRGLAYDEVEAILHDDGRAMDQVPDGITAYGFYGNGWFAWSTINDATNNTFFNKETRSLEVPLIESFNDYHLLIPATEYTIFQTIDDQIFGNGYLASQAADQPSAARQSSDALTGMSLSTQVAGDPHVNDALTNYAATSAASLDAVVEPSAGSNFLTLESATASTQDADAIALSAIGNSSPNESEDSPLGDGLSAVTGTSPLEVDPNPPTAVV